MNISRYFEWRNLIMIFCIQVLVIYFQQIKNLVFQLQITERLPIIITDNIRIIDMALDDKLSQALGLFVSLYGFEWLIFSCLSLFLWRLQIKSWLKKRNIIIDISIVLVTAGVFSNFIDRLAVSRVLNYISIIRNGQEIYLSNLEDLSIMVGYLISLFASSFDKQNDQMPLSDESSNTK